MTLADILRGGLYAIDTPGALTRGAIANLADLIRGQDQHQGYRATGREMLESMGVVGENQSGLDWGDVAGLGADFAVDPLNLVGGGALAKILKTGKAARANNALRAQRLATGGMPEEVANLTKLVDDTGQPTRLYHGTVAPPFSPKEFAADPGTQNWMGKGTYFTDSPEAASSYVDMKKKWTVLPDAKKTSGTSSPRVMMAYGDARHPFEFDEPLDKQSLRMLFSTLERSPHTPIADLRLAADDAARRAMELQILNPRRATVDILRSLRDDWGVSLTKGHAYALARQSPRTKYPSRNQADVVSDALRQYGFDSLIHNEGADRMFAEVADAARPYGMTISGPIDSHSEVVLFDPSQIYSPWIAPAEQAVPRVSPLASILAAYNAQKAYPRQ